MLQVSESSYVVANDANNEICLWLSFIYPNSKILCHYSENEEFVSLFRKMIQTTTIQ